ncbi:MAG: U32 family peptidase [Bacteroidaceae bacterium]|nr:U32 family peptidase [Bacteroidaceae bacterium]
MTKLIELLAPARDLQTGIEAVRHGADAVYIGAARFGARADAGNPVEDIRQLVEYAHLYHAKVYVTLNTIIFEEELDDARRLIEQLSEAGTDALIVQDMAVPFLLPHKKKNPPVTDKASPLGKGISLHASTQMDNRTADKVAWLRDLGFEQVVLARELTLNEIQEIHQQVPDVKLEVFVHGAICVSYNGQCYASQHCFGRSANRGQCAQFCRMPFDLIDKDGHVVQRQKHLLSLRDMNRSSDMETLLDAGVSSLKIEGRLKDPTYVKNVVAYYRQKLDEIFQRRPEYCRSSLGHATFKFAPDPVKSFNRGFTDYFLHGRTTDMANIHTPKNMGELVGYAQSKNEKEKWISIVRSTHSPLHNGDGLCFLNNEGQLIGFRVNRTDGNKIYLAGHNDSISILHSLRTPTQLYRNHDQQFEQLLSKATATRKIGVRWLLRETDGGFLLRLTREDGLETEQEFTYPHEAARCPQTEPITRQLSRLGDTPYECMGVKIETTQNLFIPGSVLAEWRRTVTDKSLRQCLPSYPTKKDEYDKEPTRSDCLSPALADKQQSDYIIRNQSQITYLGNVANQPARQFYLNHGATQVDWAMEVEPPHRKDGKGLLLMTCRYCIRHELGMCSKNGKETSPLYLRLSDGRRFHLHFDCRKCQMLVYTAEC